MKYHKIVSLLAVLLLISGCDIIEDSNTKEDMHTSSNISTSNNTSDNISNMEDRDITYVEKKYTDKYFYQQWYINYNFDFYSKNGIVPQAGIDATKSMSKYTGRGIKIAIIDDGLDIYHEDLEDALIASYDIETGTSDVSHREFTGFHGTAVSGIVLARDNDKGIAGIAPEADLIFLRYVDEMTDAQTIELFNKAVEFGADIIVCSWGTYNVSQAVKDKIIDLANNGRGGLGIPIVFAVGNDGTYMGNDESAIGEVISVGASNIDNDRAWYSNYGEHLDILAPGGDFDSAITTLDDMGDRGVAILDPNYILYDDYDGFAGTSPSAAIVGGAIALMLEANPNLTRSEIEHILKDTAQKIGDTEYINGRNDYYGYGKLDLDRAIEEVEYSR